MPTLLFNRTTNKLIQTALIAAIVTALCLIAPLAPVNRSANTAQAAVVKPNIVFIFADDLDRKLLPYMPNVKALLTQQGTTFSQYIYNIALCCPSRATMLRGQYAHNTHVFGNNAVNGGYGQFYLRGNERSTLPIWLKAAGYRTGYFGKYFNGYPDQVPSLPTNHVPPGWDDWFVSGSAAYDGFTYRANNNGILVDYGTASKWYSGDTLANQAQQFLRQSAAINQPFYLTVAPYAPHAPFVPAPRHAKLFPGLTYPKRPNFNEADVSDKLVKPALLTATQIATIDSNFRKRVQAAQSVDETVKGIVDTLQAQGKLANTIIAFTSDNGLHMGEHRLAGSVGGKQTPYEEDIRVPLIIRGPGIPRNTVDKHLVGNADIASTFARLAGVTPPSFVDGRSLTTLFANPLASWRKVYLMQRGNDGVTPYLGLRTDRYTYVEYDNGSRELYDLLVDPYQLNNSYATAPASLKAALHTRLVALKGCQAATCRSAESVAIP